MTAKTLAHLREQGKDVNEVTRGNIEKVTRYRADGEQKLEEMVGRMRALMDDGKDVKEAPRKRRVYPDQAESR